MSKVLDNSLASGGMSGGNAKKNSDNNPAGGANKRENRLKQLKDQRNNPFFVTSNLNMQNVIQNVNQLASNKSPLELNRIGSIDLSSKSNNINAYTTQQILINF